MKTILSGFILTFFLVFGCAVATAESQQPVSTMQLELVEQRLTHQQALMQKDLDRVQYLYSLELDRIRDIADATDRFGLLLTVFGGILTILLFIGSWAIYVTVSNKAKEEARDAARQWFDSHEQQHQARLDALQSKFDQLDARTIDFQDAIQANSVQMQQHVEKVKAASDAAETQIADVVQAAQQNLNRSTEEITQLTEAQKQILAQQNQNLREKPEVEYNFEDWRIRAFNAHEQGQLDKAVVFWGNAAEVEKATDQQIAQALFNKGVTLGYLGRSEEEIDIYDQLVHRFGASDVLALQERVARVLVYKGMTFSQLGQSEKEIATYDEIISRFESSNLLVLQEQLAIALFKKGVRLGQLEKLEEETSAYDKLLSLFEFSGETVFQELIAKSLLNQGVGFIKLNQLNDAIRVFDRLISRYATNNTIALQEQVANAFNGKGFVLLINAKANWGEQVQAQQQLNTALSLLQQAISKSSTDNKSIICGNLAYVEFLLGQPDKAETHLREAIEKGGETLYRDTLDDIAMHPIEPDAEFKALLERVWQSINPS